MPNVTKKQAKENLLSSKLTSDQLHRVFARLKKLMDQMSGEFLWPAVKTAHQAKGIKAEQFARDLFVSDGTMQPIHIKNEKWDSMSDPYSQLDLQVWCRYLLYGKGRILDRNTRPYRTAEDQDAFFDFIHLALHHPYGQKNYKNRQYTDFCDRVEILLNTRNLIEHENHAKATLAALVDFVYVAADVLAEIKHVSWNEERDQWKARLFWEFFHALGSIDYELVAVTDYMEAVGYAVPVAKQPTFKKLLAEANMIDPNGKMVFFGNVLDFLENELPAVWKLAEKDWERGKARLQEALRGPLPPHEPLTQEQKTQTVEVLEKYHPQLKDHLVEVIKAAHQSARISLQIFENNLYIAKGTGKWKGGVYSDDAPLLKIQYKSSTDPDPYKRLDMHGWMKYLRFGGCRRDAFGNPVTDQNSVFDFLGIPYAYTTRDPRALTGRIAEHLAYLNNARNDITSHKTQATIGKTTTREIFRWYEALLALLVPMSQINWQGKQDCENLLNELKTGFQTALGGLSYRVSDLLGCLEALDPLQAKALLKDLWGGDSDDRITTQEDIGEMITHLPAVLDMIRDFQSLPHTATEAEKRKVQIQAQSCDRDAEAVRFLERTANGKHANAAAEYYLGCCSLFGRGREKNSGEAMALIGSAARKGYAPAQVRMGQHCQWQEVKLSADHAEEAFRWYQLAAQQENADGWYHLGCCYQEAVGTKQDLEEASRCFQTAERMGNPLATVKIAQILTHKGDPNGAMELLAPLIARSFVPAMWAAAEMYGNYFGQIWDFGKAKALYLELVKLGEISAYHALAEVCTWEGEAGSSAERFDWLQRGAQQGDPECMYRLGDCYQYGSGVNKDEAEALACYMKAAQMGFSGAAVAVANCYCAGIGTEEDPEQAACWYRKESHNSFASQMLGAFDRKSRLQDQTRQDYEYLHATCELLIRSLDSREPFGSRKKQTLEQALLDYELAWAYEKRFEITAGTAPDAYTMLEERARMERWNRTQYMRAAFLYMRELEQDREKAVELYLQAAQWGLKKAMRALGRCYAAGTGVQQDPQVAMEWYQRAADTGDVQAMVLAAKELLRQGTSERDRAVALLKQAADRGNEEAVRQLSAMGALEPAL